MENKSKELIHISTDEMLIFLSCKKPTPEFIKEANRINSHIKQCETCQKEYARLIKMQNTIEDTLRNTSKEEKVKSRIEYMAFLLREEMTEKGELLKGHISDMNDIILSANLKIRDYAELTAKSISGMGNFVHPKFSMALRSDNDSLRGAEKKSVVADENDNKFTIERDGTLQVELSKRLYNAGMYVFLVPDSEESEVLYTQLTEDKDRSDILVAEFLDVLPGNYVVAVK